MKTFTLLAAFLAAASAAVLPRQSSDTRGTFNLTNFSINGVRMSSIETYSFNLRESTSNASTYCVWTTDSSTRTLQTFPYEPCKDASVSFAWVAVPGSTPPPSREAGWNLRITRSSGAGYTAKNQTACMFFPDCDVKTFEDPNPFYEYQYLEADAKQLLHWVEEDGDKSRC